DAPGDVSAVVLEVEQAALVAVVRVDGVLVERGAGRGVTGVRLHVVRPQHRLLVEEQLTRVAAVAALVTGVRPGAVHVDLHMDVHAAALVPAGEDGPEVDVAVPVRAPGAAQVPLVVARLLVAAATARGRPAGRGCGRGARRRWSRRGAAPAATAHPLVPGVDAR